MRSSQVETAPFDVGESNPPSTEEKVKASSDDGDDEVLADDDFLKELRSLG